MLQAHNKPSESIHAKAVEMFNKHFAAAIDLYDQIEQAHGDVRRPAFTVLHDLFYGVAGTTGGYPDTFEEGPAVLEGAAYDTVRTVFSSLPAFGRSARQAVEEVAAYGDPGAANLFTEVSRDADRQVSVVEARLTGE